MPAAVFVAFRNQDIFDVAGAFLPVIPDKLGKVFPELFEVCPVVFSLVKRKGAEQ